MYNVHRSLIGIMELLIECLFLLAYSIIRVITWKNYDLQLHRGQVIFNLSVKIYVWAIRSSRKINVLQEKKKEVYSYLF